MRLVYRDLDVQPVGVAVYYSEDYVRVPEGVANGVEIRQEGHNAFADMRREEIGGGHPHTLAVGYLPHFARGLAHFFRQQMRQADTHCTLGNALGNRFLRVRRDPQSREKDEFNAFQMLTADLFVEHDTPSSGQNT